ncbi:MAG TPA: rRNA maturation RNase YbeY [Clostridiaceae bacterium]|nr:rRNA maturation RNase YbeY [Clostridiaceae bacterium]
MSVVIENAQDKIDVTEDLENLFKKIIGLCFEVEEFHENAEVNILLTDDEGIRALNKQYREIDAPTDVLSFPMLNAKDGVIEIEAGDYDMEKGLLILGDIAISLETAAKQAQEYGHSFERELAFLATHGFFHLLGYDHMTEDDESTMMDKQEEVLKQAGLHRK